MTTLRSGTPLRNMLTTSLTPSGPLGRSGVARVWLTYSGASNSSRRSMLPCSHTSQNRRMTALLSSADIGSILSSFPTHPLSDVYCCGSFDELVRGKSRRLQRNEPWGPGADAAHRSRRSSNSRSQDSGGVHVVVHAPRIELDPEQHGNEHDRTRQARHPLEHITHRDESERAQSDEDDTQRHRRTRHLQRGLPLVMAKAHPRTHGHRQIDGEHQGGEIGSLSEQVWIAEERSSPEEREGQDRTPSAHHQAHLHVVPEEVSRLAKKRARWCTFRGSRGHGDHLLFLEDRKASTAREAL